MGYTSIVLSSGHGKYVAGASGNGYKEHEEAVKVVNRVAQLLKEMGVKVIVFEESTARNGSTNLQNITTFHNKQNRQLDFSIHFNSASATATGTEVLYYSGADMKALASNMSKKVSSAMGIRDRGAKQRKELWFLRKTTKPAILIEVCFISNANDMKAYVNNFEKVCIAIAEAIAGKTYTKPIQQTVTPKPTNTVNTATNTDTSTYKVVKGDTLYSIAKRFNTSVANIQKLNNMGTSTTLSVGQVLIIAEVQVYTVVKGDTLYSIAKRFNTTVDKIKQTNGLKTNTLSIGKKLIIK